MTLVWLDGRVVEASHARVSVADRGFVFGDGLFETMRCSGKAAFRLEAHLERLAAGAARLGIPVPPDIPGAIAELLAAGESGEAALRLTLTRGPGGEGLEPPVPPAPTLAISLRRLPAFPAAWYARGLSLRTSAHRVGTRSATAGLKTIGYLPSILALLEARSAGADDALVLDDRDRLAECSASNLFWVSAEGTLRSPSRACGILPGVTRSAVLDLVASWGLPVEVGEWPAAELRSAGEAFATSSLRGVVPVTEVDGAPVGNGRAGEVTRRVISEYAELLRRETG